VGPFLLALLLLFPAGETTVKRPGGACVPGTSIGCDDHDPCTQDRCGGDLVCVHAPLSGPACTDHDACTKGDHCEAGRCVGTPVTCEGDGFTCTDDVCVAGACAHVPVDSRCVPTDQCTTAVCAPEHAAHDGAGCAPGEPAADGQQCAEDGDACTTDVCADGQCRHDEVDDRATCSVVQGAFRHALALEIAARTLLGSLAPEAPDTVARRLAAIRDALDATARTLAGKTADTLAPSSPSALRDTPVQRRARAALDLVARARPEITAFVRSIGLAQVRARVGADVALDLGRRGRRLLRGTRALRAELQRLLRVTGSFVR
jgi:hypothetical protein